MFANLRRISCLVVLAAAAGFSSDAEACANVTQFELDRDVRNVALAEKDLGNDDFVNARRHLRELTRWEFLFKHSMHHIDEIMFRGDAKDPSEKWVPVAKRAYRLYAVTYGRDPKSTPDEQKFARETMLDLVQRTSDPTLAIDAAEVFSHHADLAPAALMMLRGPAEKDLIGSAWAYAALARLEKAQGNAAAETTARERCRRMAKRPTICDG